MCLLGLITAVEFFENAMFVFGAAHIMGGLDATPAEFVRAQAAYAVGCLMAMVMQQYMAARYGYRRYLLASMVLFSVALLACAHSQSLGQLTGARLIQGLGGGTFFTSSRILVPLLFAPEDRGAALKRFIGLIFGASALAPACSAWLIENRDWSWVFYAALPPALLACAGIWYLMPAQVGRAKASWRAEPHFHLLAVPMLWFAVAVVCVQLGLSEARFDVLAHPLRLLLMLTVGLLMLALFLWQQWHQDVPLLHLRKLQSSVYLTGLGLYFVHYFLSNFSAYLFPIFAESGLGFPLAAAGWLNSLAGWCSLILALAYMKFSPHLRSKRWVMLSGLACFALYAGLLSCMPAGVDAWHVVPAMLAKGAFGVLLVLPVAGLTFKELGDEHFAHGYQGKNMMRQLAAIMLQNRQFALHDVLGAELGSDRVAVRDWLTQLGQWWQGQGMSELQARSSALLELSRTLTHQALLLACEDLYRLLVLLALLGVVAVLSQRKLL